MKAKEKALTLIHTFTRATLEYEIGRQCALIAVDEIIDNIEDDYMHYELDWWLEVKHEINKL
jgi:hypothetical protein